MPIEFPSVNTWNLIIYVRKYITYVRSHSNMNMHMHAHTIMNMHTHLFITHYMLYVL